MTSVEQSEPRKLAILLTLALWTIIFGLLMLPLAYMGRSSDPAILLSVATTLPLGLLGSALLYCVAARLAERPALVRNGLVFGLALVLAAVLTVTDAVKDSLLMAWLEPQTPDRPIPLKAIGNLGLFTLLFGFTGALHLVLRGQAQLRARERDLAQAREAAARAELAAAQAESAATNARLAALRYQLNPHFLFNTLNAISSMVVTNRPQDAEGMLAKLSEFLRGTLAVAPDALIPLEDELGSVADYLSIEGFRLRDRLNFHVDCPPDLAEAMVPSFLLQPLIENAIKHGVAPTSRAVTIAIRVSTPERDMLRISVEDDGGGPVALPAVAPGFGIGLSNVEQRLRSLYGDAAAVATVRLTPGFAVQVSLPLHTADPAQRRVA
jgi:signal transduction histidine kinase